jgi:hypothetical protein|tara:strand:- start:869 stop:1114 length:246 start_codon:yes stop_codon:yes gene_type:complete
MRFKKAMSPLVSTVLLIGFAAILGLVVMGWGTGIVGEMPIPDQCSKVTLSLSTEGNAIMVIPKLGDVSCKNKKLDISEIAK